MVLAFLVSINYLRKLLKISRKNLQGIGAKTREFEACLLHFPQSYVASMAATQGVYIFPYLFTYTTVNYHSFTENIGTD